MSVNVFFNNKWHTLAGQHIYQDGTWKLLNSFDKFRWRGQWYALGYTHTDEASIIVDEDPMPTLTELAFENVTQPSSSTHTILYVSLEGNGSKNGLSWENAVSFSNVKNNLNMFITRYSIDTIYFLEGIYDFTASLTIAPHIEIYRRLRCKQSDQLEQQELIRSSDCVQLP